MRISYSEISSTLDQAADAETNLDGEDIAMAIGLSRIIKQFVFLLVLMSDFLETFGPVDRLLQSRSISFSRAMPMIEVLQCTISDYRTDENFTKYKEIADKLFPMSIQSTSCRNRRRSTHLTDFVVESSIGERSNEDENMKATYFEIIDVADSELKQRFLEHNNILLALSNACNMDIEDVKGLNAWSENSSRS